MEKELYSDTDLRNVIENEGFGYAIYGYMNPNEIESPETKRLWLAAYEAMVALAKHLKIGY